MISLLDDEQYASTIEAHATLGTKNIIIPWLPLELHSTAEATLVTAERLTKLTQKVEKDGFHLGFHAHDADMRPLDDGRSTWYILGENTRVVFAERALRADDFEQFGQYLFQSHDSSRDFFHNSCPELDLLVDLARAHPACLGARLTGGGFGGATVNLVSRPLVKNFMQSLAGQYHKETGRRVTPLLCQIVDGAE